MNRMVLLVALSAVLAIVLAACAGETAAPQVIEKEVIVEKEVVREVPVEKVVTQEIVKTIEVPVEKVVTQEVIKEVQVPGETVVVTKEVVKEVPVEVVVTKEVVKEVPVEVVVEVPKEVVREVVKIVEVEKPTIVRYGEAPQLAQLVAAGKLPPVAERLPSNPMVIPVFGEIGKYGGLIRRGYIGSNLSCNYGRPIRTGLLRFSTDGFSLVPAVAASVEGNDNGTVWTAKLREGMRWSDGAPFTADDFVFHHKMVLDDRITPILPAWVRLGESEIGNVVKVDDYTVEFRFEGTNYVFGENLVFQDGDCGRTRRHRIVFAPSHYLEQFHVDFNANAPQLAKDMGFETWEKAYQRLDFPIGNPDRPSTRPWVPTSGITGKRIEADRNAYFYAVDPVGNQLPYIDKFVWDKTDKTVLQLKVLAGEIDFQGRQIAFENFPTLKGGEDKGGYSVFPWPSAQETDLGIRFNQAYQGPEGEYFRMEKFRRAVSLAANREEMNTILFHGVGLIKSAVPQRGHPFYPGDDVANIWMDYDPAMANQMLDEILPNKDAEGFRLMSNGDRLHISFMTSPTSFTAQGDTGEMLANDLKDVGISFEIELVASATGRQRISVGEYMGGLGDTGGAGYVFTFPAGYMPAGVGSRYWADWYTSQGKDGIEPPDDIKAFYALWDKGKVSPEAERVEIGKQIYTKIPTESRIIGLIGESPMEHGTYIVNKKLRNVPPKAANAWPFRTPSPAFPEQFWWSD